MNSGYLPSFGPAGGGPGDSFVGRGGSPSAIRKHIDRRGLVRFGALAVACAVLAAAALFQIWVRTEVTHEAYRLTRLTNTARTLESERRSLEGEVARLRSPPRIEGLAREKLGMGPAKAEQILILTENTKPSKAHPGRGPQVARR